MTEELEKLYTLVLSTLKETCPQLSGNMKRHIKVTHIGKNSVTIQIQAKFYDIPHWRKTKQVKFTKEVIYGKKHYAEWVNSIGAFGHTNRSTHWANKAIYNAVNAIANEIGAEVNNELPL